GSSRQLLDLAALLHEEVLDPARPLWTFTVVDGLEDDRAALITKMHHTLSDGVGAIRLSAMFTDAEPDPDRTAEEEADALAQPDPPALAPSFAEVAVDAIRRPLLMGCQAMAGAIGAIGDPFGAAMTALDIGR